MPEEKKKEKRNVFSAFESFSIRKYWRAQLLILAVFFLGFGLLAYFGLGSQAKKLVGGERYNEHSATGVRENVSIFSKVTNYFTNQEPIASKEEKSGFSFEESSVARAGTMQSNTSASNESTATESSPSQTASSSSSEMQPSRLGVSFSRGIPQASASKSKTELSNFIGGGKNLSVEVSSAEKANMKNMPPKSANPSALSALKGAWKASLYGARLTSQDAAKSWTARSFDASQEDGSSLKYDEKFKSKLDRLNPDGIPQYLKEQNIEMDALESAKPSHVPDFDVDNGKKEKDNSAKEEMKDKFMKDMKNGMLNPMYGKDTGKGDEDDGSETLASLGVEEPETRATLPSSNNSMPSVSSGGSGGSNVTTDEFGYIRVTGSDGTIQIFDPDSGEILGCEIPDAGMCVFPGAENCPSGAYFT